jgi:dTDP-4-amino-4,6-dideoxygalactose transaminase
MTNPEKIPFLDIKTQHEAIRAEVLEAVAQVYDSHWYILGEHLRGFESAYAAWNGVGHAVGVASGLDALHIALKALGIQAGQEVIVPSNTYIATWLAVSSVGAMPVPVEPDPHTWNLSVAGVEAAISPRTAAVLPVHLFGQACEMDGLMALANRRGLFVVEDNAQAQGARCRGRLTGSFGHINATSFYPTKNLGALGDAGALTTDSEALATFARTYRNYGSSRKYENEMPGINSRLDEIQAAILAVKLRYLEIWNRRREQLAQLYLENLKEIPGLTLPQVAPGCSHVWHLFVVQCTRRDGLQQHLAESGIQTMVHYPIPPHLQAAYARLGFKKGQFPLAERLAMESLSLPLFPGMTVAQLERVCGAVRNFYN